MDPRLATADSELAKAYSALRALLPTAQRAALLYSQREWIAQRDGGCQGKRQPNGDGRAPAAITAT